MPWKQCGPRRGTGLMPLIDTSVIIRYFTGDNEELAERAAAIIETEEELIVTDIVIVETGYVLTKLYGIERKLAVDTIIALLQMPNVSISGMDKSAAFEALLLCRPSNRVSFADAFIWIRVRKMKNKVIYSFDKRFPRGNIAVRTTFSVPASADRSGWQ
jgi:predicted nucleic-acid-binding protein